MSAYEELLGAMLGQRPIGTKGNAMRLIAARDAEHAHELAEKIRGRFDGSIIDDIREQDANLIDPEVGA